MHLSETQQVDAAAIALGVFGVLLMVLGRALGRAFRAVDDNLAHLD